MQDGQSTQIDPIISRQKSTRPAAPRFNESSNDYTNRPDPSNENLVEDTLESGWTGGYETLLPMELDTRSLVCALFCLAFRC